MNRYREEHTEKKIEHHNTGSRAYFKEFSENLSLTYEWISVDYRNIVLCNQPQTVIFYGRVAFGI